MRKIVLLALFAVSAVSAQPNTSLLKIDSAWQHDPKTAIGSTTRIAATQQNPFPFCFSTAAAMLYDQTLCNQKLCGNRTSFLAITSAGQQLDQNKLIPNTGGSPLRSLQSLLKHGPVDYSVCNYEHIASTNVNLVTYRLATDLSTFQTKWQNYAARAPYLSRYYKYQFKTVLQELQPKLNAELADKLIQEPVDIAKITALTLLSPECLQPGKPQNLQLKFTKVDLKDLKQSARTITALLKAKKPVLVSFCLDLPSGETCDISKSNNLHSFIIVAQNYAVHKATGDRRMIYWVVNSWGEEWQTRNVDGWIYADRLLESLTGEIVWLE